jgi:hypothetical protein
MKLYKGYLTVNDKTFVAYIGRKQGKYKEGDNIATEDLMMMADNKFKLLKEGNTRWNTPLEDEEKILALHAPKIKSLQKQATKAKKGNPLRPNDGTPKDKAEQDKPKWLSQHSKKPDDLKKPKSWNSKMWHWCSTETGDKCAGNW